MADSPQVAAAKFARLARKLDDQPYESVQRGSLLTKKALQAALPSRLRGVGKKGAKIGVRYTITRTGVDGAASLIFTTGPTHLIERDTSPHRIPRERTRGKRRFAVIPGVGPRAFANHPGTKGKHTFDKTTTAMSPVIRKQFDAGVALTIHEVF